MFSKWIATSPQHNQASSHSSAGINISSGMCIEDTPEHKEPIPGTSHARGAGADYDSASLFPVSTRFISESFTGLPGGCRNLSQNASQGLSVIHGLYMFQHFPRLSKQETADITLGIPSELHVQLG